MISPFRLSIPRSSISVHPCIKMAHHIFLMVFNNIKILDFVLYIYMYCIYIHVCKNANNVYVIILSIKCICVVLSLFVHVDKEYELIGKQLRYTLNRIGRRQQECAQILRGLITNMNIIQVHEDTRTNRILFKIKYHQSFILVQ